MKNLITRPLFLTLDLLSLDSNSQMQGTLRAEYVDGYTKSCYRTQRAASVNTGMPNKILLQFCSCIAEYTADLLNNQLAMEIQSGSVRWNPQWTEIAFNYCVINHAKK